MFLAQSDGDIPRLASAHPRDVGTESLNSVARPSIIGIYDPESNRDCLYQAFGSALNIATVWKEKLPKEQT